MVENIPISINCKDCYPLNSPMPPYDIPSCLFLHKLGMMHVDPQRVLPEHIYIILECLRLPKRHVRLYALPSHQTHIRLPFLLFVLDILEDPSPRPALEPLRIIRSCFDELLDLRLEPLVLFFKIAGEYFGNGGSGAEGSGGRVRGQVRVMHGEGTVDDGHEVFGEGHVSGGRHEFLVGVY